MVQWLTLLTSGGRSWWSWAILVVGTLPTSTERLALQQDLGNEHLRPLLLPIFSLFEDQLKELPRVVQA